MKKLALLITAASAWLGLILITYVASQKPDFNIVNIFSFFTIQSNVIVALFCTYLLFKKNSFSKWEQLFQFGAMVNIAITGLVYTFVLASIWSPQGLEFVADALLHYVTPLLYVISWLLFLEKRTLRWSLAFAWLLYPIGYLVYSLIRGSIVNWYPYPFIDASVLSVQQLVTNCIVVTLGFVAVTVLGVVINNSQSK